MIKGLHHASITTGDIDRLTRFYRDLLGFEIVLQTSWDGGNPVADAIYALDNTSVKMVMLKTANAYLELFQFDKPVGTPGDPNRPICDQGHTHICLNVSDIHAEHARLSAAGMRFHCPPQRSPGIGHATYGRDPDGNILELLEPDPAGPFVMV